MAARSLLTRGARSGVASIALAGVVLFSGCDGPQGCAAGNGGDAGSVRSLGPRAGRVRATRTLPRRRVPPATTSGPPAARGGHRIDEKVHPALRGYLQPGAPDARIRVIVSFRDRATIPRFPDPPPGAPEATAKDTTVRLHGGIGNGPAYLASLLQERAADYDTLLLAMDSRHGATGLNPMWLIRAVAMNVRAREVRPLAERRDVVYVEPARSGEPPPQDGDSAAVRGQTGADPLIDAGEGYENGLVALIDTGVRATHRLLQGTGNIRSRRDCVDGDADCAGSTARPGEACPDGEGHGTGTAAILTGNDLLGDEYRGMTDVRIDSYRVYDDSLYAGMCSPALDTEAAITAVALAATRGARVLLVETQGAASSSAGLAGVVDNAFKAGCVVIAPVGNTGANDVRSPANARGALGIGAYDIASGAWYSGQSYGTTEDGRPKPDLIAATGILTASARSDEDLIELSKTSGAGPVATGMAVLLRNFLRGRSTHILPGYVYAAMIAATDTTADKFEYERAKHGAGRLAIPDEFDADRGFEDLATGDLQPKGIEGLAASGAKRITVAIWWPDPLMVGEEGYTEDTHSDVNLELVRISRDGEEVVAESSRGAGTFERVEARITGSPDDAWEFRITAHSVPSGTQRVYWAWITEY